MTPDSTFHPFEIALCGFSNTGKTTLTARLVSLLSNRYAVGYYKHGCHRFDIDREGKDSHVVRQSGATTVMLSDPEKHALIGLGSPDPLMFQTGLLHVDFLIVEGLKELPLPKLLLVDRDLKILDLLKKKAVTNVLALIAENPASIPDTCRLPLFQRDNTEAIAGFIEKFFYGNIQTRPVFGLVLVGGKSKRMGKDKALLAYHKQVQAVHTAKMLLKQCTQVYLSCRAEQQKAYGTFGFPLVVDSYPNIGPLGGLLSAQRLFPEASWLVAACDLPFMDQPLLHELSLKRNPFSFATAYRHSTGEKPEPLCAIYEPKSRLPLLMRHAAGNNSLRSFLEDFPIHYLSVKDPDRLQNINTPDEQVLTEKILSAGKRKKT